ncbi:MAG TPA: diacylglycerol kinase family protein [Anaerolineae bacterium]|nr:diacylglycerol kinase family protein [Anaerolineae bacterium]
MADQVVHAGKFKRVHVIINPASGQDAPVLNVLNRVFKDTGIEWDVSITKAAGDARRLAQQAVTNGAEVVAVYGGDGSVAEAASGLIGAAIPLAILPGGTGNVTAAGLGIPRNLTEACALLCTAAVGIRPIDMGQVGERYFLLRVSVGLEADVVEGADRELKDRFGPLAYMLSALQALSNPQLARYQLTLDGREVETAGLVCMIANSGYLGRVGVSLAPGIDVSDGLLDVVIIARSDLGALLSLLASAMAGNENAEALQHWQAREISVVADPPQTVQADGEIIGKSPVQAQILPGAIRVVLPEFAAEA